MTELIRLRDLPYIQRANEICLNPRNFEYPSDRHYEQQFDLISVRLFGITRADTLYDNVWEEIEDDAVCDGQDSEAGPSREEWERNFSNVMTPYGQALPFWTAIGWDVSDGRGNELTCLHYFGCQIIAVAGELVDGAVLTLDGSGKPFDTDPDDQARDWGRALLRGVRTDIKVE